ncbi:Smr domain protein [Aspergillus costaricaensis CBS 115574]|uniref:Smr domain protein n=1 Tax=Aspergillus costaricaensis CBS 115574 TaxID=1448317 RepID=A0ACD1I4B9_9EURO|nr:Smr domain protein [Aspergillus costaricaensis CBS 115574]RAK85395.1 Smr domain protein [Aspergillus costaricaensis CBS 115574]
MGDKDDGPLQDLEKTYCPPLDPALLTAIAFDYDLTDSAQLGQLRETLDALRLSAWEQEDLPFDPSGTSGLGAGHGPEADGSSELSESQGDRSRETDITSLTSGFSSVGIRDHVSYTIGPDGSLHLSGANEDDKIGYLTEMFPSVDRFTIQHTLKKSNGSIDRSMDVLLNLSFFDEQVPDEDGVVTVPKGVDGFDDPGAGKKQARKRKPKNKNARRQDVLSSASSEASFENTTNKWDAAGKDVEFIHARTSAILKKETVRSTYHANGASLPATIRALADTHAPKKQIDEDPVTVTQVAELTQEFPSVPPLTFAGLLKITRSSISAASELAAAMLTSPVAPSLTEIIKITTAPPPVDVDEETPKRGAAPVTRDLNRARSAAGVHFAAGAEALSKASVAYRRGKSDRLMGGAAAYYSAVGRDHLERAKRNAAAAADALVDSQSTWNSLDLHGVSVQDAVRISSERVSEWWDSLGDAKYMRGSGASNPVQGGYRIVTGLGRHSHDGTSRLGPAVAKMLAREGWRVEIGAGVLTVVGVVQRR